uniref:Uncharacterized protein n=1 Tax=Romanomermis culicivorax TaxID=13658 RepID=A0A915HEB0_ROMCU
MMLIVQSVFLTVFIICAFGQNENSPCDVPGQDDFIFVPVKKSIKPTVCDPNIETGAIPLKQTPCIHNLNGKNYTVLKKQKSKNYVQWEFCRDVRLQKFNGHKAPPGRPPTKCRGPFRVCQHNDACYLKSDIMKQIQT